MINHCRTLLLNQDGVGLHGYVGEAYSPPDFHAVELPSYCHDIHRVLFGQQPDWLMRSYRAYELLQMLHATELEEFVLDYDARITYSFETGSTPFASVFPFQRDANGSTQVVEISETGAELFPTSNFESPDILGRCFQQWLIELTTDQFKITHETRPRKFVIEDTTFSESLSELTSLPESSLQFRARETPGASWRLYANSKPQRGIGDLESDMGSLSEATIAELFCVTKPSGKQEPWKTFNNLWSSSRETPYRLGAIVLALIYQTHNIWLVE